MKFAGTERVTIEIEGTFAPTRQLPVEYDLVDGRARVSLFAFHVDQLHIVGIPFVRSSYAEVLWRVAARHRGDPAWWVAACDLAAQGPAIAARRWVKYPVRMTTVEVTETTVTTGDLAFTFGAPGEPATVEQRTLLTGELFQVPWGDDASGAHRVSVTHLTDRAGAEPLGSEVAWSSTAILRKYREHRCGSAIRV